MSSTAQIMLRNIPNKIDQVKTFALNVSSLLRSSCLSRLCSKRSWTIQVEECTTSCIYASVCQVMFLRIFLSSNNNLQILQIIASEYIQVEEYLLS